ncbi:cytochrome P460 family protein [Phaeovulum sp. W22_SRMD_FR3]|uniref:cytochrome P460 family protein n=1 Tax=Phaeovulum sp. W22_SRMD_FR3 TaxID=3240274 RepID=UPI003F9BBC5B
MRKFALITAIVMLGLPAWAEPNRVTFPPLDQLEHYTTVTRGEVTEHMLTSRAAIDAVEAGQPIPFGTHVVLVDYREGEVYRYFVMQNGEGWGADDPDQRTADWQFQWFWPDRSINVDETTSRCQSCHQSREDREFMFTYNDLRSFD